MGEDLRACEFALIESARKTASASDGKSFRARASQGTGVSATRTSCGFIVSTTIGIAALMAGGASLA
jgi:hypothetical protein